MFSIWFNNHSESFRTYMNKNANAGPNDINMLHTHAHTHTHTHAHIENERERDTYQHEIFSHFQGILLMFYDSLCQCLFYAEPKYTNM